MISFLSISFKTKEDYVNYLMNHFSDKMYTDIECFKKVLINNFKNEKEKYSQIDTKVSEFVLNAFSPSSKTPHPTYVDVEAILSICLSIHSQSAFLKKISLKSIIDPSLPPLYIDEFHFKQIIMGMLEISLQQTPSGGKIRLYASVEKRNGYEFLKISIIDNGFGLNNEDILRISSITKSKLLQGFNFYCSFSHIELIVKIYGGECSFKSAWKKGRISTVDLPYLEKKLANKDSSVQIHPLVSRTIN
jgi:K+-sensing histidine kinase KdpD